ncbi:glycosyltransferase family 4 protein [Flavobacterium maritimum]|uniref:glycosyltransferase family 4 protein n=1 Tax=Flavobacterium maritimum TaxID=3149042 RepID=UPI0032B3A372
MRIGLVLAAVPGYSETFFVNKIKGLQSHGHEVILFVNSGNKQKTFEKVTVVAAPQLSGNPVFVFLHLGYSFLVLLLFHFGTVLQLYRLERKDGSAHFSIVKKIVTNRHLLVARLDWLHFGFGTMVLERENLAQAIGAKMAVSFRGFDYYVYPMKHPHCYAKLFSKDVRYHVLSDSMKKGLVQQGVPAAAIFKITPAIATDQFTGTADLLFPRELKMVTVARLHWIKGLEYILEALALLQQQGIMFQYTIIGDGPEKERLLFAAHQLGLANQVTFAGKLPPSEVKKALEQSDVYLQYSIQEGFCNAVLEAQAMGKICIVSDAEGLSENIIDKETGFVVPKRNPVSLCEKIVEVVKMSESEKKTMMGRAITRTAAEFKLSRQIKKFTAFYESD